MNWPKKSIGLCCSILFVFDGIKIDAFTIQGTLTAHIKSAPIYFFLHYITTYSAYFNSMNNSARNLLLFEEKSREKPGRFSANFNSTPN